MQLHGLAEKKKGKLQDCAFDDDHYHNYCRRCEGKQEDLLRAKR